MKNLYLIGGAMGVGKTTVCRRLKKDLPNSVFLDGDWCWDADPFLITEETKAMVMDNICFLLNNFLRCSAYENIIFCWVMHEQSIIDEITKRLDTDLCLVKCISLTANEAELPREKVYEYLIQLPTYDMSSTARQVLQMNSAYYPIEAFRVALDMIEEQ